MRALLIVSATALVVMAAASTASADVRLTIQDGRVTLIAKDATVRQILTEWARVGQTKIVNVERIPGGPVTLELRDVPERQALRVLLRSVGGYVTAQRETALADASMFDRILVMPVVAPAPAPPGAAPPPAPFASFTPPQFQPQLPPDDDRDDGVPPQMPQQPPGNRGPVFVFPPPTGGGIPQQAVPQQGFPQQGFPQQGIPQQAVPTGPFQPGVATPAPGAAYPGAPTAPAPVGASAPGMIVPAPQPQQQPGQPGFPGLPPRVP